MDNFDLKKFLTENKLTSLSRRMNEQTSGVQIKGVPFPNPNSPNEILSITYISDGSPYRPGTIYNEVEDYIYSNLKFQEMGEYVIDKVIVIGGTPEDLQVIAQELIDDAQEKNYSDKPIIDPSKGTIVFDPELSYAFNEPDTWY